MIPPENTRINVTVSPAMLAMIQELVAKGLYGFTPTEVVRTLVSNALLEKRREGEIK